MLEWFNRVQHNIVDPHTLGQRHLLGRHTACRGENAHRAAGKDLEQQRVDLLGRESRAKVCHRSIAVLKGVLLRRDEQFGAMDREGQVNDETDLVALPLAQGLR